MDFIDFQINGAFGVDFNSDELTADEFRFASDQLRAIGVVGFFPTIITDSIDAMCSRIRRISNFVDEMPNCRDQVLGIHVEGPFISPTPGFFGTHPPQHIKLANIPDIQRLIGAGRGLVRLVTLAPEQDLTFEVTARLRNERVLVFAGHSNAPYETLQRAIDAGLTGVTHLGNGCAHQVDRQDNFMQRVLALRDRLVVTLIVDGIHVPLWLIRSWVDIFGVDRCIVVSDSISAAGMGPGEFSIGNQRVLVDEFRRTKHAAHGYLAGSASTMADMDHILASELGMGQEQRRKLMHDNALRLL